MCVCSTRESERWTSLAQASPGPGRPCFVGSCSVYPHPNACSWTCVPVAPQARRMSAYFFSQFNGQFNYRHRWYTLTHLGWMNATAGAASCLGWRFRVVGGWHGDRHARTSWVHGQVSLEQTRRIYRSHVESRWETVRWHAWLLRTQSPRWRPFYLDQSLTKASCLAVLNLVNQCTRIENPR